MSESGASAEQISLVRINKRELTHKLLLRGKSLSALREVTSGDSLAKIARGESVSTRVFEKITAKLAEWPELEHAADLLAGDVA